MKKNIVKIEALHCPFCGAKPKVTEGWGAPAGVGVVWCVTITCSSRKCAVQPQLSGINRPPSKTDDKLRNKVIKTWNKRA